MAEQATLYFLAELMVIVASVDRIIIQEKNIIL
jgi:hypothetical protein